ncbi:hypothetical protein D3C72_2527410 [compost metagenome]
MLSESFLWVADALIRCNRSSGSASSVARSTISTLTWLFAVSSPNSRKLAGTAALIERDGSSRLSLK